MLVENKIVVLSGAAGGIGSALAGALLDAGSTVIAVDIAADKLDRLRDQRGADGRLETLVGDVASEDSCRALAETVRRQHGKVDILINNAGYFPSKPFREISYAEWQEVMRINLDSVFLMTQAFLPLIEGRGWGRIINIGSASVFRGVPTQVHYVSAKAGIVGFTRSMALVLGPLGITVNIVAPGLTSTPAAVNHISKAFIEDRMKARAIAREQQPEDLTGAVLFLASSHSDFMTGQTLNVDGGTYMN